MKFKQATEYDGPKAVPIPFTPPKLEAVPTAWWECLLCTQKAVLIHKGTGYCRACYDKRNYSGTLIG